ncbi:hypothetical protein [Nocardioides rubriscoriae]|uniref:hypothetical protein n=1 Tax=Nocardioides rubriscoriae TaxID=642762 RepID=UPI001478E191|nr:hypothetical protein [Nocardioides rubriscoriae]
MMGNGATAEVDAALHARLESASMPVFVVVTRTPPGFGGYSVDDELASLIHAGLGLDGIYYVHTSLGEGHLATYGDVDPGATNDDTLVALARYTALEQVQKAVAAVSPDLEVPAVAEAAIVLDIAARPGIPDYEQPVLTDAQVAGYTARPWVAEGYVSEDDPTSPPSVGLSAVVGVTVALVVAITSYRLLNASSTARGRRTARAAAEREQVATARRDAQDAVEALELALERSVSGRGDLERRERASRCADAARGLLRSTDLLDLVGAAVLARTGTQTLRSATDPYRCCFIDPRHGRALHDADLVGGLSVPVCRPCQRDLRAGRKPAPLYDGSRPYYEGDSVWARIGYGTLSDVLCVDVRRRSARW